MSNLVFAIPSYKRPLKVKESTINTLENLGVPKENIYVFVANDEELISYKNSLGQGYKLVVGELGIGNQRTFINGYFPEGTRIVSADDDLLSLVVKDENKSRPFNGDLVSLVTQLFDICDEERIKSWGVNPCTNGFFMTHELVIGLRQSLGEFYGEYSQLPQTQSDLPHTEDVEKFVKHYLLFGGMMRVNDIGVKQKYQSQGGVVSQLGGKQERVEAYHQTVEDLVSRYPDLVKRTKKETDYGRIRVVPKTVKRLVSPVKEYQKEDI
jgi:hypothetical protein